MVSLTNNQKNHLSFSCFGSLMCSKPEIQVVTLAQTFLLPITVVPNHQSCDQKWFLVHQVVIEKKYQIQIHVIGWVT